MEWRKIVYNTFISAGARMLNIVLVLVVVGLLTRYLGQAGFGYYSIMLAFLFFFTIFSDLGLYSICLRDMSRPGADQRKIVSNAFTIRLLFGLVIFALAPLVARLFPYSSELRMSILIGAIGFWFLSDQQVLIGVFQRHLQMTRVALADFLGRLVQLILVIIFIWRGFGLLAMVWAMTLGALVSFLTTFILAQKYVRISLEFDLVFWRDLLKKSLPLGLAVIFTVIYFKMDALMLSVMKGPADTGIYSLAHKMVENILFFPAMFVGLVMPLLSEYAFSQREKFKEISQKTLSILLLFAVPLIIGTIFLSKPITVLLAGRDFVLSAGVLNILILAAGIIFLGILFSNMLIALEKQRVLTFIYGFGAVFNFFANLFLIPQYSYYGASVATVLTELSVTLLMVLFIYRATNNLPYAKPFFKYVLAGLVMGLFLYFLAGWNLFVLIILAGLIYFALLYLLGAFSIKELKGLILRTN